jgi:D-alanyl-lipoteichoic acid acyltransferase DltB (MBOAT superfamily)
MLFNSYDFMLFFPVVLIVYFVIPKKVRYIWLLVASYWFYMGWNPKYALLIAFSTLVTYFSGIFLDKVNENHAGERTAGQQRKIIVAVSFIINIGILIFFKYFDFILENVNAVLGVLGITLIDKPFDVILPVGISFYTFQALSYTMDVYRGEIKAEKNPLRYALFVSFFPQLVAGPIERSKNLLRQIQNVEQIRLWNYERIAQGAVLMLWGYFQKMVIADRAAILVDQVYNSYWSYGGIELILATVLFAVQIYCDFASYSQIAIGAAKIMGFELMENFNTPYFASSVQDFWRRWHISLSTWLRDYLYIPLGGSRCSKAKKYRNIMITFLTSGLWHGASWNYIIWGGLHGCYQIVGDILRPAKEKFNSRFRVKTESFSYKFGKVLVTFVLVDFAWIFFRADSLYDSIQVIGRIVTRWDPWVLFDQSLYTLGLNQQEMHILLVAVLLLFLMDIVRFRCQETIEVFLEKQCLWFRWGVIFFLLLFILVFGIYGPTFDAKQFIYFQF